MQYLFVDFEGEKQGPWPASQLKDWFAYGHLTESTMVWADGMQDWAPLMEVEPLYALCKEKDAPASAAAAPAAKGVPVATSATPASKSKATDLPPPVVFIHDSDAFEEAAAKKYERRRLIAKWSNCLAAAVLAATAGIVTVVGPAALANPRCPTNDTSFERVVFCWLSVFGLVMLLAELSVSCIRTYVHFLAYRTGRAATMIYCATIIATKMLCEKPSDETLAEAAHFNFRPLFKELHWKFIGVFALLVLASVLNINLAAADAENLETAARSKRKLPK
eukprot:CAMPEP_0119309506 /NCGR_PEP_ID=MMETSP1333-20130426/15805_1 /TAXON_ID=418940 /ORGANISM="Scyphosphaera apsteinii, Strain RCC1455" /LENGTH=277 /DNA_ID=CAMNT_0007313495 /DNA_START=24 /DNA_END=858 /DNA_ORIENTATION=-